MSYCLNPTCTNSQNLAHDDVCQTCGSKLLLCDRYRATRFLGRGGFAATFLAIDQSLPGNPACVIKQLRPMSSAPDVVQMARELFQREAATLGKIGYHPQLPRLLDYFELDQNFYLIQEYISGPTLAQEMGLFGPSDEPTVKAILREVLTLLDYLHNQQVIHRDIKPANIIRRSIDNRLVLIDFGAVKEQFSQTAILNSQGHSALTVNAVGTLGFAPPEQMARRPVYASDIYSLGVTGLYLLTGKLPQALNYDPTTGELDWCNQVSVSQPFQEVLAKMLAVSIKDRYQSAKDVLTALESKGVTGARPPSFDLTQRSISTRSFDPIIATTANQAEVMARPRSQPLWATSSLKLSIGGGSILLLMMATHFGLGRVTDHIQFAQDPIGPSPSSNHQALIQEATTGETVGLPTKVGRTQAQELAELKAKALNTSGYSHSNHVPVTGRISATPTQVASLPPPPPHNLPKRPISAIATVSQPQTPPVVRKSSGFEPTAIMGSVVSKPVSSSGEALSKAPKTVSSKPASTVGRLTQPGSPSILKSPSQVESESTLNRLNLAPTISPPADQQPTAIVAQKQMKLAPDIETVVSRQSSITTVTTHDIANAITRGLVIADRNGDVPYRSRQYLKVQDVIYRLRLGQNRYYAAQRAGVPQVLIEKLLTLGGLPPATPSPTSRNELAKLI